MPQSRSMLVRIFALAWMTGAVAPPNALRGQDQPPVTSLTVFAKAPGALKNRLLPSPAEMTKGNAAQIYLSAALLAAARGPQPNYAVTDDDAKAAGLPEVAGCDIGDFVLAMPLDKLRQIYAGKALGTVKRDTIDGYIQANGDSIRYMRLAARRTECVWEHPVEAEGIQLLLPHLSWFRTMNMANCVKAKWQIADGDYEGAIQTLQSSFALAKACGQHTFIVEGLVGGTIAYQALQVLQDASEQPGCPNFYWLLNDLPKPLLNYRDCLEVDRKATEATFPLLPKARQGSMNDADWHQMVSQFAGYSAITRSSRRLQNSDIQSPASLLWSRATDGLWVYFDYNTHASEHLFKLKQATYGLQMYPEAKRFLKSHGMTAGQIDAMPPSAVLGKYTADSFDLMYDHLSELSSLPVWQARPLLIQFQKELDDARDQAIAVSPLLQSRLSRGNYSFARVDRIFAAAQTVEALRAYAAGHGGTLPASLDQITDTPSPIDPTTGKLFSYHVDGTTATIESHVVEESPREMLIVKVTIKR